MAFQNIYGDYAFTRNPVALDVRFPENLYDRKGGIFKIESYGKEVFEGRVFPPATLEISRLLDSFALWFPEPVITGSSPVIEIEDAGELANRMVDLSITYSGNSLYHRLLPIPGGVSKQNLRVFASAGTDAFKARFFNYTGNFFFTTRSASWIIPVKESELFPFYFIVDEPTPFFKIKTLDGLEIELGTFSTGVYALDLNCVRKLIVQEHSVLANVFDLYADDKFSCRFIIERAEPSKNRSLIKFRNSLGVFEYLEITTAFVQSVDMEDSNNKVYSKYDPLTADYNSVRERIQIKDTLTAEIEVSHNLRSFLMDMLCSEEVYITGVFEYPVHVIPSVEEFSVALILETPKKITVLFEISEADKTYTPDISTVASTQKPGVFSQEFNDIFN